MASTGLLTQTSGAIASSTASLFQVSTHTTRHRYYPHGALYCGRGCLSPRLSPSRQEGLRSRKSDGSSEADKQNRQRQTRTSTGRQARRPGWSLVARLSCLCPGRVLARQSAAGGRARGCMQRCDWRGNPWRVRVLPRRAKRERAGGRGGR